MNRHTQLGFNSKDDVDFPHLMKKGKYLIIYYITNEYLTKTNNENIENI